VHKAASCTAVDEALHDAITEREGFGFARQLPLPLPIVPNSAPV